jgi:predicted nuclease of predicted toxin-antitoxin system
MQFLADENFPLDSIQLLKEKGFVVRSVFDVYRGKPDAFLLLEAIAAEEIVLTFDKDFGELVFKSLIKGCRGIVLFRMERFLPDVPALLLISLITEGNISLENNFTVIDADKIRQRPI